MIKFFLIASLFFLCTSITRAETNPFGKDFFSEPPPGDDEVLSVLSEEDIVEESSHPLLRYDLRKYLIIGTVLELSGEKRSLAIIRTPDSTNHIVFLDDILSKDQPPWIIKNIDLRGITVQKEDPEELDEKGNPVYLEENIEVNNLTIDIISMDKI